jgi:hypothetical protein
MKYDLQTQAGGSAGLSWLEELEEHVRGLEQRK